MSQENVELTLLALDAWNRRDVEATVALWDREGGWYPAIEGITEGRSAYRGHAGVRRYFEDLAEYSEESHAEFPKVHDLGDQVLGLGPFDEVCERRRTRSGGRPPPHMAQRKVRRSPDLA